MTTRRAAIIAALRKTPAPGATAAELCAQLNTTVCALNNHIKHIRKTHTVITERDTSNFDARFKRHRIEPSAATMAATEENAQATPHKPRTEMSAEQMEAAICALLDQKANRRYPLNMAAICDQINQPSAMVRPAIIALVQRETIDRTKGGYFMRPPAPHALRPDPNKHQPIAGARVHVNAAMPNGTQEYWAAQMAWGRRP